MDTSTLVKTNVVISKVLVGEYTIVYVRSIADLTENRFSSARYGMVSRFVLSLSFCVFTRFGIHPLILDTVILFWMYWMVCKDSPLTESQLEWNLMLTRPHLKFTNTSKSETSLV